MTDKEITDLLLKYKENRQMDEIEFYKFCKRYATRDVSTVVWLIFNEHKMPLSLETVKKRLQNVMLKFSTPPTV